ncbi:MAG: tetratricopeptide repeat protein, partial [Verrucomicrobiae bacterium]|nr:tetratricopeptide repeat protein [Verrucomicrobiae bacterium]
DVYKRQVLRRLGIRAAIFGALIFALHPIGVASAAWVSERKNTLSMVFFLVSLLGYLHFDEADRQKPRSEPGAGYQKWYWFSLGAFLLALLSKTSVVVLPALLVLYHWWHAQGGTRAGLGTVQEGQKPELGQIGERRFPGSSELLRLVPFFVLALILGLVTVWFQRHRAIGAGTFVQAENLLERAAAAGWALWFYLGKALLPLDLSAVYPRREFVGAGVVEFVPLLLFLGVLALAWRFRRGGGRHVMFGLGGFALSLAPTLGFVDMFYLTYSRVADHWAYLALIPVIGLVLGGANAVLNLSPACRVAFRRAGVLLGMVTCAVLGVATFERAQIYRSELALWSDVVRKNPFCHQAHNNLGLALTTEGRYMEAQQAFERALELKPDFVEAQNNMGFLCDRLGRHEEAADHYQRVLKADPGFVLALNNWGVNLIQRNRRQEGMAKLEAAIQANPAYGPPYANLANALLQDREVERAFPYALQALQLAPLDPQVNYILGNCWFLLGDFREAARCYETAFRLRPEFREARHNLGVALLRLGQTNQAALHLAAVGELRTDDPNFELQQGILLARAGQLQQAVERFQQVVQLKPQDAEGHNRLGFLLAKQGQLDAAIAAFREALRLDPNHADARKNLGNALFESGQPQAALGELERAARLAPESGVIRAHQASVLAALGRDAEALEQAREAVRLQPGYPTAHYVLANLLLKQNDRRAAREHYLRALESRPDFAEAHYQLGILALMEQNAAEARQRLGQALRYRADWPEALNNLAWLLATHPNPNLRNGPEALRLAKRAVELAGHPQPEQLDTLAAAYAEAGDFASAVATAHKALEVAQRSGQDTLATGIATRLQLYAQRRPYREEHSTYER